ncbi:hypothetical protein L873DRAFT_770121 [Choiromyces venosus 120613-1]|uniref:Uncharacterized protein n=1 Tax=Choiromyces venosus 120613-1 TaxID=1336337 RepID=A0A3N4JQA1_9PEZI|nr:hypothetical protein L873DRAFT_770121 [Choiromyces venosus 120613-1]
MKWVLNGFPVVEILRDGDNSGDREPIDDSYGYCPRDGPHAHIMTINSFFFDHIEQAYREGVELDATIFMLFATVAHEFGHYLNGCWWIGGAQDAYFRTPRGIRYLVQLAQSEDSQHPKYDPYQLLDGEMGQVIEWLIFGFMIDMPSSLRHVICDHVFLTGWGSYPGRSVRLNNWACRTLMKTRPHLRLPGTEIRIFAENLKREEENYLAQQDLTDTGSDEYGEDTMDTSNNEYEDAIILGDPPDVISLRSGVDIPNSARGKSFRNAFVQLEVEIERARARRRPRRIHRRAISCGLGMDGWNSEPDARLHNNLHWRTDEVAPSATGLLPILPNFDLRIIMVGYIFLCIASDYGLKMIWPMFTSAYSSILTAIIMILGIFSVRILDPLMTRPNSML